MSSKLVIAATDIYSSPVLARKFRGKIAKEVYPCCDKGIVFTGSLVKPVTFTLVSRNE